MSNRKNTKTLYIINEFKKTKTYVGMHDIATMIAYTRKMHIYAAKYHQ